MCSFSWASQYSSTETGALPTQIVVNGQCPNASTFSVNRRQLRSALHSPPLAQLPSKGDRARVPPPRFIGLAPAWRVLSPFRFAAGTPRLERSSLFGQSHTGCHHASRADLSPGGRNTASHCTFSASEGIWERVYAVCSLRLLRIGATPHSMESDITTVM